MYNEDSLYIADSGLYKWSQKISIDDPIPSFVGLYAVYYNEKLAYIGKATNLYKRLAGREFLRIENILPDIKVYIRYFPMKPKQLRLVNKTWIEVDLLSERETRYLRILKPPLNLDWGHGIKNIKNKPSHNSRAKLDKMTPQSIPKKRFMEYYQKVTVGIKEK